MSQGWICFSNPQKAIIVCAFAVTGLLAVVSLIADIHFLPDCIFRWLSDIPCPFCGMTRALKAGFDGNLLQALLYNPLLLIWFGYLGLWLWSGLQGGYKATRAVFFNHRTLIALIGLTWASKLLTPQVYW